MGRWFTNDAIWPSRQQHGSPQPFDLAEQDLGQELQVESWLIGQIWIMVIEIEGMVVLNQSPQGWHSYRLPCVYFFEDTPVTHERINALLDRRDSIGLLPICGQHPLDFCRRDAHFFCDLHCATYLAYVQASFGERCHDLLVRVRFLPDVFEKGEPVSTEIRGDHAL